MPKRTLPIAAMAAILSVTCTIDNTASATGPSATDLAHKILHDTGVTGGLIVQLGCGDGNLAMALGQRDGCLVHALDINPRVVEQARANVQSHGQYGPVSVDSFDGRHLPYADNLVNLLVAKDLGDVSMPQCLRVLAPGGVAYVATGGKWTKTVKPWPEEIDQWTHPLHGPDGNAVAQDRTVGPPARLQWRAGPLWARSHGWTPSVSAMVSAEGRLFCICDETLTGIDAAIPSKWFVVARDAFSGVLLWKRRIPSWGSEQFSGTPNTGGNGVVGRFTMPPDVGKRLVAVGDTVFVTLGPAAPVTALDAATGKVKQVYAETARADEVLCLDGCLVVSINPTRKTVGRAPAKHICAVDVEHGELRWKKGPFAAIRAAKTQDPFGRLELIAGDGKVFALTTDAIHCLDLKSGETIWQIQRPAIRPDAVRRIGFAGMYEYLLTVMVYHDGVVLLAQPEPNTHHTYHTMPGMLYAFDARDGQPMWKHSYGAWGHCTPPDVFAVSDTVWTHVNAKTDFGFVWGRGYRAKDPSKVDYRIQALDLRTGQLREELSTRLIFNVGHHHRCYRNRITERFLLSCRRGVELVNLSTGENFQNHWVRSGCLLGYLPCNGLLYVTPHPCGCYVNAMLKGFNALAPSEAPGAERGTWSLETRLHHGPAYGTVPVPAALARPSVATGPPSLADRPSAPDEWPTYRHDPRRSGATPSAVGTALQVIWRANIGTAPSPPVIAGGKVLVAGVDTHTVHALDADRGTRRWQYTAGARVDSPPTVANGLAIFGSADGCVRGLRATDGALVWQLDAAPHRRLVTALGQLESAWPVPGSVLMHDGKCWFAAGRSSYLDGGIHLLAVDPATGKVLHREMIYSPDPETGKMRPNPDPHSMPGLLNDILATDGANVFIRQLRVASTGGSGGHHLYTTAGYRDSSWFNRTFWQVGRARTTGLMVLGKTVAYGVEVYPAAGRESVFRPGANSYRLRCLPLNASPRDSARAANRPRAAKPVWEQRLAIRVTAMVHAGNTIVVAGPPDVVDPQDPHGAWEGRKGGVLAAIADDDGRTLAVYKLASPPVWDGMAVAGGRLVLSTLDGHVVCLK